MMSEMMSIMKDGMLRQFGEHLTASNGHTEANHDDEEATTEQVSPGMLDAIDNNPDHKLTSSVFVESSAELCYRR